MNTNSPNNKMGINTLLACLFYYIGHIASKVPSSYTYDLYQFAMRKSIEYNDLSEYKIWKEFN